MKKTILTSIIALAAFVAMPTVAQTIDGATGATKTEQTQKVNRGHRDMQKVPRHDMKKTNAFDGITLTDAQKEALKGLCPKHNKNGKHRDIEAGSERRDSVRPDRNKMRADYVNGVKSVLTPEQYVVFLENIVIKGANIPGGDNNMRKAHIHKGDNQKAKKSQKGNRPNDIKREKKEKSK